jgi:uncharacterized membrane protein
MNQSNTQQDFLWIKAIVYRVIRITIVFISSFFILGDTSTALKIAGIDTIAATIFYYYYDKTWPVISSWIGQKYIEYKYRKLNK